MRTRLLALAVLTVLLLTPIAGGADGLSWSIKVDNPTPNLGDPVIIHVVSRYPNEDAHIEVVFDKVVVRNIWLRSNALNVANVTWQTELDSEPGLYTLRVVHMNKVVAKLVVELVYDPLDYALKRIVEQEMEIQRLQEEVDRTEGWIQLAMDRIDYYLYRWVLAGMVVNVLAIITLVYLGPEAFRQWVLNAARKGRKGAEAFARKVDGYLLDNMGKETMGRSDVRRTPVPGQSKWCPRCEELVHRAEWRLHEGHDLGVVRVARVARARKVTVPRRVVKVRNPHTSPMAPEVD